MEGPCLLVSDLDGTLSGDEKALARFADWYEARRGRVRLAYNSGRRFDSVTDWIRRSPSPEPDAVIGALGTEIRLYPEGEKLEGWPRCLGPWDPQRIRAILGQFQELEPQPDEFQGQFKLSYYGHDLDGRFLVELRRRLALAGHCVEVLYSPNRDLDVLPAGVNKGSAAAFLASRWMLRPWQVIVSGATGNDRSMFLRGFRGVVVSNAHPELKAVRSPDVYHSRKAYAAGVLDGIHHWFGRVSASVS